MMRLRKTCRDNDCLALSVVIYPLVKEADHAIDSTARLWLEQAIALEPDNRRALWLFGISQFQQQDYAAASVTWRQAAFSLVPRLRHSPMRRYKSPVSTLIDTFLPSSRYAYAP